MPPERRSQAKPAEATGEDGVEAARALAERVLAGERSAVSTALNQVDDDRPASRPAILTLLDALEGRGSGVRVGITGAPGAGKSTLLDALVSRLRARGRSVGVLAIDPSSQRTGGALLGDRMRLGSSARDAGVFLRSLAARDRLGGLSEITGPSLDVLSAAFDFVFVETVGVGQSESDVIDLVDTLVFVAQPAAGDLIQFMKAGILEWPDVFFVGKSDLGDVARRAATELMAGLELGSRRDPDFAPVVLTGSARDGIGIDALIDAIDAHQDHLARRGRREERRLSGRCSRVLRALEARYGRFGLARLAAELGDPGTEEPADCIERFISARADASVERLIDELSRRTEEAIRHDGD